MIWWIKEFVGVANEIFNKYICDLLRNLHKNSLTITTIEEVCLLLYLTLVYLVHIL